MHIILHRANTLESINKPWKEGVFEIEVDAWVTSDKKIVLSHDTVAFDSNKSKIRISEFPYDQLFDNKGNKLTLLSDVLDGIRNNKDRKILIEVKCGIEIINPLKKLLLDNNLQPEQVKIIGFIDNDENKNKMRMIAEKFKGFNVYAIFGRFAKGKGDLITLKSMSNIKRVNYIIENTEKIGAKGIIVRFEFVSDLLFKEARKKGLTRYIWELNDTSYLPHMISQDIDGIITDEPILFKSELDNLS